MRLQSLNYAEFENDDQEWILDSLRLGPRNLIVGKNAVGKTRTLNVIDSLSRQLAGLSGPGLSGSFDASFSDDGKSMHYELVTVDQQVTLERFSVDGRILLDRGVGGEGTIWSNDIEGHQKEIRFQTPPSQLAAVARRDSIQHSFLEPLHSWGSSVRHIYFGSDLGKNRLALIVENAPQPDYRDPNAVLALFRDADKEFGAPFRKAIVTDLLTIGYDIEEISLSALVSVRITTNSPTLPVGLSVKERNLRGITDQHAISQGMFRALATFVHVNYCQFRGNATCILIDDIGEGLDFDRSCRLIDRLREKTKDGKIQLVLTTNDRFIMNRVPLEEWIVLQRTGSRVTARDYENSRDVFEEFKFTGLSNFSFLEMDMLGTAPLANT